MCTFHCKIYNKLLSFNLCKVCNARLQNLQTIALNLTNFDLCLSVLS